MTGPAPRRPDPPEVVVLGGGLIGLACALALAERGAVVTLLDEPRPGVASAAGAGLLAPSLGTAGDDARAAGLVARDLFPAYVRRLRERTGIDVPLDRNGILEVALDDAEAARLRPGAREGAEWLDAAALARLEPALAPAAGALLHPDDGAVDTPALLHAMARLAATEPRIRRVTTAAASVSVSDTDARVRTADGGAVEGDRLVLAAGAWAGTIAGLPRAVPVEPVRGQMLALAGAPLRRVAYGAGGYLVPRDAGAPDARTLVGATAERAGFDASTTDDGLARLTTTASRLTAALAGATPLAHWAGLRPMTPDLLPLLGPDPRAPALLHACGHSRNGILLAPLTGECIAALVFGERPPVPLAVFDPARFGE